METATAPATETAGTTRWTILLGYFAAVVVAEIFIAIPSGPAGAERPYQPIGLGIHILLVFTLMFGSVVMEARDRTMATLLVATSLASLVRVFSLAVPRYNFLGLPGPNPETNPLNTIPWLALVSIPLLVSIASVAYVQRLRPKDLGLHFRTWSDIPIQTAIAMTGIPLGVVEFEILKPGPWIPELAFASLHIFFLSAIDMAFVFSVGLFYGYVVLKTKNLWGAIFSHSLGNVILYLVAPFVFR